MNDFLNEMVENFIKDMRGERKMKYKVGDKVRIRSDLKTGILYGAYVMSVTGKYYGGKIVTIAKVIDEDRAYEIEEDDGRFFWTDEMIEGKVEDMEKKEYKGWELLKEIAEGKIKKGTVIKDREHWYQYDGDNFKDGNIFLTDRYDDKQFASSYFEIMEELEEIDIQDIKDFYTHRTCNDVEIEIIDKINELIQAVKQLDKEK